METVKEKKSILIELFKPILFKISDCPWPCDDPVPGVCKKYEYNYYDACPTPNCEIKPNPGSGTNLAVYVSIVALLALGIPLGFLWYRRRRRRRVGVEDAERLVGDPRGAEEEIVRPSPIPEESEPEESDHQPRPRPSQPRPSPSQPRPSPASLGATPKPSQPSLGSTPPTPREDASRIRTLRVQQMSAYCLTPGLEPDDTELAFSSSCGASLDFKESTETMATSILEDCYGPDFNPFLKDGVVGELEILKRRQEEAEKGEKKKLIDIPKLAKMFITPVQPYLRADPDDPFNPCRGMATSSSPSGLSYGIEYAEETWPRGRTSSGSSTSSLPEGKKKKSKMSYLVPASRKRTASLDAFARRYKVDVLLAKKKWREWRKEVKAKEI